jgi:hypothetical protein
MSDGRREQVGAAPQGHQGSHDFPSEAGRLAAPSATSRMAARRSRWRRRSGFPIPSFFNSKAAAAYAA